MVPTDLYDLPDSVTSRARAGRKDQARVCSVDSAPLVNNPARSDTALFLHCPHPPGPSEFGCLHFRWWPC
jgi:hypothetical protein